MLILWHKDGIPFIILTVFILCWRNYMQFLVKLIFILWSSVYELVLSLFTILCIILYLNNSGLPLSPQNRLFHVAIGMNWTWIQKLMTPGRKFLDSTFWFQYPGRLSQEKYLRRWEGCPKHMDTAGGGGCPITLLHSTRQFSAWVKEDKMGDLLSDSWRKLLLCMP